MKFLTIRPKWPDCSVKIEDHGDHHLAVRSAGLDPLKTDHGVIRRYEDCGLGITVYEFGLFDPASELWTCCGRLWAGPAVIYQFDPAGETIDFDVLRFANPTVDLGIVPVNREIALTLIADGHIARPQHAVNGEVTWQWPQPMPEYIRRPRP